MLPFGSLNLIAEYPLILIAIIIEPFLVIGLGIYSGFNIKKRWFLAIIECIAFFVLFKATEWFFETRTYEIPLSIAKFEIIMLCICLTLSLLAMFVTVIMRRKESCWIRILVSSLLIIVVSLSWGIGLNKKYCPTYYKYPDYIIKEVLTYWDSIEFVFGEFDIKNEQYYGYGAYYAYTDEQGNCWYYTIYFDEGKVMDICMEIH